MSELFDQYAKRFTLTRADYKYLKSLNAEDSSIMQAIIEKTYNANGELEVGKYLESTYEIDEMMADHINAGNIKTAIHDDPYRLNIFIPDYPPRLKEHNKTKFSPNLGYTTKTRWYHYVSCALHELRNKGAHVFKDKVIVVINYYYTGERYDVDNYAIKFINDAIKYSKFIVDDSHLHLATHTNGKLNLDIKGTEIIIASYGDFMKNPAAII